MLSAIGLRKVLGDNLVFDDVGLVGLSVRSLAIRGGRGRRCRVVVGVELSDEVGLGDASVTLLAEDLHVAPVHPPVESDADPASPSDVRGPEEPRGILGDEHLLSPCGGCAPKVGEAVAVVAVGPKHDELLADEEGRCTVALLLAHPGQRHADRPDPGLEVGAGHVRSYGTSGHVAVGT